MVNVYIKSVEDSAYRLAKILAAQSGKTIGQIFGEAIQFFYEEKTMRKNPLEAALGLFGRDDRALERELKALREVRKQMDRDFEKRFRYHERLRHLSAD